jgi:hypothetical protein
MDPGVTSARATGWPERRRGWWSAGPTRLHGTLGPVRQPRTAPPVPGESASLRCSNGSARRQRHPVAGVALEPAIQLELHERPLYLGRARLALPDQLVDTPPFTPRRRLTRSRTNLPVHPPLDGGSSFEESFDGAMFRASLDHSENASASEVRYARVRRRLMPPPIAPWFGAVVLAGIPLWTDLFPNPRAIDADRLTFDLFALASAVCAICVIDCYELASRPVSENRRGALYLAGILVIVMAICIPTWSSKAGDDLLFTTVILAMIVSLSFLVRLGHAAYKERFAYKGS